MVRVEKEPLAEIVTLLNGLADPERAVSEKKYLKSDLHFLGVSVPKIRKAAKDFAKDRHPLGRHDVLALAQAAWQTDIHELRSISIALLALRSSELAAADLLKLEAFFSKANTWAHVDWLAISVAGPLVERYVSANTRLKRWAKHENYWLRRAALLALLEPLRRGEGDFEAFEAYAVPMLEEKEFFIRKAIGWILREVSKKRPHLTVDFVNRHRGRLSGLSYREATKRLSPAWEKKLK